MTPSISFATEEPLRRRLLERSQRLERRHWNAFPDIHRPELLQQRSSTAEVVGIAMCEHHPLQPADSDAPQYRCHDAVAHVERGAARQASGINNPCSASREPNER